MNARHRGVSTDSRADLDAEGPLRRWARRKREVAREKEEADEARGRGESPDASEAPPDVGESADDAAEPNVAEPKVLTDEDMPSLESLDENSDYSGFLSSGVSEEMRRRALRKLFSSAVFNIPDGLDDYDDDFTSFAALGDIVTADMRHQAEMEAERARQARTGPDAAVGHEDESDAGEERRTAHVGGDEEGLADVDAAAVSESSEARVPEDPGPTETVANEDAIENSEAAGQRAHEDGGVRGSPLGGRVLVGSALSEGVDPDNNLNGKAAEGGEFVRFTTDRAQDSQDSRDSAAIDRASDETRATTNADEGGHRRT
ncbi:MAG: DUF3306 domain-containing protein [Thiotrichales bacterium]|nr:DUF3306 domain-containing protein [Thiotrichales bacterium]